MAEKIEVPIPSARPDDAEDVSWGLSTAEAMWARGDYADAIKWLRRAAESASEAQHDDRALQLAKAAAELAPYANGPAVMPTNVAPAPVSAGRVPPPPLPAFGRGTPAPAPVAPAAPKTAAVAVRSGMTTLAGGATPPPPVVITKGIAPRGMTSGAATTPGMPARPDVYTPAAPPAAPSWGSTNMPPPSSSSDGRETWPTGSLLADDSEMGFAEATRIGAAAYTQRAKLASSPSANEPPLRPAQALRVIVWRAGDVVHVAPAGTTVSAITVDAMLVALDPSADLAAWFTKK